MDTFRLEVPVGVRFRDLDVFGHVNNAVYFTYIESARVEFVRKIGFKGKLAGATEGPALVSTSCDFKRQVVYPATLDVGLRVERVGRRSFEMSYGIFVQGADQAVATGRSVNAWVEYAAERAVELPDWFRAALAEYQ